jgi:uncharacterized protein
MARLDRDSAASGPLVQAFTGNGFRVDGAVYPAGIKLTPLSALEWAAPSVEKLQMQDLADVLSLNPRPEFLILGTGASLRRPDPVLVGLIETQGVGLEVMDSRAAARAWGVLRGEDRWIAAALMPLDQTG